jgi:hypothetical protein
MGFMKNAGNGTTGVCFVIKNAGNGETNAGNGKTNAGNGKTNAGNGKTNAGIEAALTVIYYLLAVIILI